MAMKPRDAANVNGRIDAAIGLTSAKLRPHLTEITTRLSHRFEVLRRSCAAHESSLSQYPKSGGSGSAAT
jgi:hypothetical protein